MPKNNFRRIPGGGSTGQALTKASNDDRDVEWSTVAGGGGDGLTWEEVTTTTKSAAVDYGYIINNASLVTVDLPATAAVGSIIRLVGKGAGGWQLDQSINDHKIYFGTEVTPQGTGTGTYIASTDVGDCVELVCITSDDHWRVISSVGNIEVGGIG